VTIVLFNVQSDLNIKNTAISTNLIHSAPEHLTLPSTYVHYPLPPKNIHGSA